MPFHQVGEALAELAALHGKLAEAYARAAERIDDPRAARLYRLIEVAERSVGSALDEFTGSAPNEVLATWLQYIPDASLRQIERGARIAAAETEIDRIIQRVVSTHEELRRLYRQLASITSAERIQALFTDIEDIQLAKISKIATSTLAEELIN